MSIVRYLPGNNGKFKFVDKPWLTTETCLGSDELYQNDGGIDRLNHKCTIVTDFSKKEGHAYQIVKIPVGRYIHSHKTIVLYIIQDEDTSLYIESTQPQIGVTAVRIVIPFGYFDDDYNEGTDECESYSKIGISDEENIDSMYLYVFIDKEGFLFVL